MPAVGTWWQAPHSALIGALTFLYGPSRTNGDARERAVVGTWAQPFTHDRWRFGHAAGFPTRTTFYTPCHGPAPIGGLDYVAKSALPLECLDVLDPDVRGVQTSRAFTGLHLPRLRFTRCTLYPATLVLLWRELTSAGLCQGGGDASRDAKAMRWLLSVPAETATRLRLILTLAPDMAPADKAATFIAYGAPSARVRR